MGEFGFISPRATISRNALIAPDVCVYGPAFIAAHVIVGPQVMIGYPPPSAQMGLSNEIRRLDSVDGLRYHELVDQMVYEETTVEEGAVIRSGCVVYAGTKIQGRADIAHNCVIRENSRIGEETHILTGTQIMAEVKIGAGCRIAGTLCNRTEVGHAASMLGHAVHRYKIGIPGQLEASPKIEDGAIVGREAAVVGGVTVGSLSVVGAGAVITVSVPPLTVWTGNPARERAKRSLKEIEELLIRVKKYAG